MPSAHHVAVVGAGLAGLGVCRALRERDYGGRITLLGAEPHRPYDRPPLSKGVLLADPAPEVELEADWSALAVDLRLGEPVLGLSAAGPVTERGEVAADAVVVATGAEPVRLPHAETPGDPARPGPVHLRTREDAVRLRAALVPGARVVVVGAGWIGAEVATAAAARGARVSVCEAGPAPLAGVLPAQVGALTRPWYAEAGIELRTSTRVAAVAGDAVVLDSGENLAADVVVVGVGVRPATGWLAGSGVEVDRGVLVDASLRASGRPGTWAVGDAVARWSPRYGDRVRGEHWDDALQAPAVLAAALLGGEETYDPVPYVWSEQLGRMLQWCGRARGRLVRRGDPAGRTGWALAWLGEGEVLTGFLAVDRPRDLVQARRLATRGVPVDPVRLADPGVAVRDCAR